MSPHGENGRLTGYDTLELLGKIGAISIIV